ncbi:MAG: SRPBCC family protein [Devosia sp.]
MEAPVARVWEELNRPDDWPAWWRAVKRVEKIAAGGPDGIGAVRRFTWATALPYTITFDMEATRIEPMHILEGRARGELDGIGRWTVTPNGAGTRVRYDWQVELTKLWQRTLAPVLRPAFAWNHNVVMGWGHEGLVQRLRQRP